MRPDLTLDLGDGLHLRALVRDDAALLVEATSGEAVPSLWGPRPAGPYSLPDARAALAAWDPTAGSQFSLGVLRVCAALSGPRCTTPGCQYRNRSVRRRPGRVVPAAAGGAAGRRGG
jgi:hypothetical protein